MRYLLVTCIVLYALLCQSVYGASTDFDGDGISDPAAVEDKTPLDWFAIQDGQLVQLADNTGKLGNHLAPGHYTGASATEFGYVEKNGTWHLFPDSGEVIFTLGKKRSTLIAGADFNGYGDDAAIIIGACKNKDTTVSGIFEPAFGQSFLFSMKAGNGRFYHTFGDGDGDGRDDICWNDPIKKGKRLTRRFTMKCKNPVSGKVTAQFNIGRVYAIAIPVYAGKGKPNLFAFRRRNRKKKITTVKVRNTRGDIVYKAVFDGLGPLLAGNYLNKPGGVEQVALASDSRLTVYDPDKNVYVIMQAPAGIQFDEININRFAGTSCYCNSSTIGRNGRCRATGGGGGFSGGGSAAGCAVTRSLSDGAGGWLHKPVSDSTGSVVDLFNPGDSPGDCRYQTSNGKVFKNAFFSGNSNPNRPTWRPVGGGSCKSFPSPTVVNCLVHGKRTCWVLPNPCQRYD